MEPVREHFRKQAKACLELGSPFTAMVLRLAADRLDGAWTPLADTWNAPFAGQNNVTYAPGVADWSDDISHGELVRDGNDETATIDTCNLQFLYQGRNPSSGGEYSQLPYRLGLLQAIR